MDPLSLGVDWVVTGGFLGTTDGTGLVQVIGTDDILGGIDFTGGTGLVSSTGTHLSPTTTTQTWNPTNGTSTGVQAQPPGWVRLIQKITTAFFIARCLTAVAVIVYKLLKRVEKPKLRSVVIQLGELHQETGMMRTWLAYNDPLLKIGEGAKKMKALWGKVTQLFSGGLQDTKIEVHDDLFDTIHKADKISTMSYLTAEIGVDEISTVFNASDRTDKDKGVAQTAGSGQEWLSYSDLNLIKNLLVFIQGTTAQYNGQEKLGEATPEPNSYSKDGDQDEDLFAEALMNRIGVMQVNGVWQGDAGKKAAKYLGSFLKFVSLSRGKCHPCNNLMITIAFDPVYCVEIKYKMKFRSLLRHMVQIARYDPTVGPGVALINGYRKSAQDPKNPGLVPNFIASKASGSGFSTAGRQRAVNAKIDELENHEIIVRATAAGGTGGPLMGRGDTEFKNAFRTHMDGASQTFKYDFDHQSWLVPKKAGEDEGQPKGTVTYELEYTDKPDDGTLCADPYYFNVQGTEFDESTTHGAESGAIEDPAALVYSGPGMLNKPWSATTKQQHWGTSIGGTMLLSVPTKPYKDKLIMVNQFCNHGIPILGAAGRIFFNNYNETAAREWVAQKLVPRKIESVIKVGASLKSRLLPRFLWLDRVGGGIWDGLANFGSGCAVVYYKDLASTCSKCESLSNPCLSGECTDSSAAAFNNTASNDLSKDDELFIGITYVFQVHKAFRDLRNLKQVKDKAHWNDLGPNYGDFDTVGMAVGPDVDGEVPYLDATGNDDDAKEGEIAGGGYHAADRPYNLEEGEADRPRVGSKDALPWVSVRGLEGPAFGGDAAGWYQDPLTDEWWATSPAFQIPCGSDGDFNADTSPYRISIGKASTTMFGEIPYYFKGR